MGTMKKLSLIATALLLLLAFAAVPASAAKVVFTEDFSSGDFSKWTNGHLDDDPETPDDAEVIDVAVIKDGQLHISNKETGGSFFYIAPKDVKAKNFKISMKVKSLDFSESWVGFSVRKDVNDRYNGSNNVLHTFIFNEAGIAYHPHRGYPGGGGVISLAKNTTNNEPFTKDIKDWHTYTLIAKDNLFTAMIDDQVVGELDYGNAKVQNAGYISINLCVGSVIIDDVTVEVHDDDAAAPQASEPAAANGAAGGDKGAVATAAPGQAAGGDSGSATAGGETGGKQGGAAGADSGEAAGEGAGGSAEASGSEGTDGADGDAGETAGGGSDGADGGTEGESAAGSAGDSAGEAGEAADGEAPDQADGAATVDDENAEPASAQAGADASEGEAAAAAESGGNKSGNSAIWIWVIVLAGIAVIGGGVFGYRKLAKK